MQIIPRASTGQYGMALAHECVAIDVPDWFRSCCSALGMSKEAPAAWASIHVKPQIACLICLGSVSAGTLLIGTIYIIGSQPYRWIYHPVAAMWLAWCSIIATSLWRNGPLPAGNWQLCYMGCAVLTLGSCHLTAIILIFGPDEHCLFQDRGAFVICDAISLFVVALGAFFGSWPPDYPTHPHRYGHPLPRDFRTDFLTMNL